MMKNFKIRTGITVVLAVMLIVASCKKEVSNQSPVIDVSTQKSAGIVPDDPIKVSKVPLIISSSYLSTAGRMSDVDAFSFAARGGKADKIPPTISITSPANGTTVSGVISILVSAKDNIGVKSVSISVDGSSVGSSSVSPYTNSWNSATVANGTHTLLLTASDATGNKATASMQVTVNNVTVGDITSPTVNIVSPTDQSSLTGTVTVNMSASDNVGVSSVSIIIDNTVVSTSASYTWNTSNFAAGSHTVTATAKDAAGNQSSKSVSVVINTTIIQPPPITSGVQLKMPPVGNQGSEGSCVAFSVGYAARSAEKFYKAGAASYDNSTNIFSPEFLYNQVKFGTDCGSGTAMQTALDFIVLNGICTNQSMPYSPTNGCSLLPTTSQSSEALNHKISSYSKIYTTDKAAIKSMVNQKHPVIISIVADNSFIAAKSGFIWKTYSGSGSLAHSIVICGYDDSKNAYLIMNSWGTGWGDAGYSWIDYDFFQTRTGTYCYAIN